MQRLWTFFTLMGIGLCGDYVFYLDIKWDRVKAIRETRWASEVPYDHGIRMLPSLHMGKEKCLKLRIWGASPTVTGNLVKNYFYQSTAEYVANCKAINGSDSPSNCFLHSNYDLGFCSPSVLMSSYKQTDTSSFHCKNAQSADSKNVFSFGENDDDFDSYQNYKGVPLLKSGERIILVYPDGTGLKPEYEVQFKRKFGQYAKSTLSLGDLYQKIRFVKELYGDEFAGILGSTQYSYFTSVIAKRLNVPNIVPAVIDQDGE